MLRLLTSLWYRLFDYNPFTREVLPLPYDIDSIEF